MILICKCEGTGKRTDFFLNRFYFKLRTAGTEQMKAKSIFVSKDFMKHRSHLSFLFFFLAHWRPPSKGLSLILDWNIIVIKRMIM